MPVTDLAALKTGVVDATAEKLFGFVAADTLAAFTVISIAASISAMVLAGPRVYFAMARDGIFFPAAAQVHPRFHTPAVAIVCQGLWSGVLILSGTLSELVNYTGFAVVLFAGIAVLSLFVFRMRDSSPRPFSTWGYPVIPAIFVLACAVMVTNELWRSPGYGRSRPARHRGRHSHLFHVPAQDAARLSRRLNGGLLGGRLLLVQKRPPRDQGQ